MLSVGSYVIRVVVSVFSQHPQVQTFMCNSDHVTIACDVDKTDMCVYVSDCQGCYRAIERSNWLLQYNLKYMHMLYSTYIKNYSMNLKR